jgi:AAA ATPase-like protein/uncharacterized protein DUF4062
MHAERDELVKRTFPQLRKLCEERGVVWSEVDLRWGITDEQSAEGKVLPICLAEIQRCRPYFIALLGERYGWIPDQIPGELVEQEPWLAEHLHKSVTELEVLHGVLNNPAMTGHAYFYFRDPAFISSLPADEQHHYMELPTAEDIAGLGLVEAEQRAEKRKQKLAALKNRIRTSGLPVEEDYANPQSLGECVLRDLSRVIDKLYPLGAEPDPLDREELDHEAVAQGRAKVYIRRQGYFERLDEHARGDGPPLVVLGESGSGKSALVANWALRYRQEHARDLLIMHFIGATPESADWAAMLRRIMVEFKRRFEIQREIPARREELPAAFSNWFHMVAARGRVVLVLDALSRLEDREGALDLVWLPPSVPANVRLILTTLPGPTLNNLKSRDWPTLELELLNPTECEQLIQEYLAQFGKQLSPARVKRLAEARQTANPLYLRALLDELRVFGIHEELDRRIDHYLRAPTPDKLYEKILERYEQDYQREKRGVVRESLSFLAAARRGLSEAELLDLLGDQDGPLPRAAWSPLYLAAEASLLSRSGLLSFAHEYFRRAVEDKYFPGEHERQTAHLHLADYFDAREVSQRKLDELPWQLASAGEWSRLSSVLTCPNFFPRAWEANSSEVKSYWVQLEANSALRIAEAYHAVIKARDVGVKYAGDVATLLQETGHLAIARSIREYLIERARMMNKPDSLAIELNNLAFMLDSEERETALHLLDEAEQICRQRSDKLHRRD